MKDLPALQGGRQIKGGAGNGQNHGGRTQALAARKSTTPETLSTSRCPEPRIAAKRAAKDLFLVIWWFF
jgi:hypothetical protein